MAIGIFYREELKQYDFGEGHPFRGDRYLEFPRFLRSRLPKDDNYIFLEAEPATDKDLNLICREDYIDFTREYYRQANLGSITPDLQGEFPLFHSGDNEPRRNPGRIEKAARLIVGQAKRGIDLVQEGKFRKVVSIGGGMHHAKPDYGEGFCIYNDVAFAGKYLIEKHKLKKVLILDTDAHAGNGTSEYFYEDPQILFIDLHQNPSTLYPGTGFASETGSGEGEGYTVNVPLPVYAGYDSYRLVFDEIIQPLAEEFKPQVIIRNGGSDPHFADELTQLGLQVSGFRMIGERVREIAKLCNDKEIDLIASGYNKEVLPAAWLGLISGLQNIEISIKEPILIPQKDLAFSNTKKIIEEIKKLHRGHWSCFRE